MLKLYLLKFLKKMFSFKSTLFYLDDKLSFIGEIGDDDPWRCPTGSSPSYLGLLLTKESLNYVLGLY